MHPIHFLGGATMATSPRSSGYETEAAPAGATGVKLVGRSGTGTSSRSNVMGSRLFMWKVLRMVSWCQLYQARRFVDNNASVTLAAACSDSCSWPWLKLPAIRQDGDFPMQHPHNLQVPYWNEHGCLVGYSDTLISGQLEVPVGTSRYPLVIIAGQLQFRHLQMIRIAMLDDRRAVSSGRFTWRITGHYPVPLVKIWYPAPLGCSSIGLGPDFHGEAIDSWCCEGFVGCWQFVVVVVVVVS